MKCADCEKSKPLEDMIRKYSPKGLGLYQCKDCLSEDYLASNWGLFRAKGISHKETQRNRLKSLLRWAVG